MTALDINYCSEAQQALSTEMAGADLAWLVAHRNQSLQNFVNQGFPGDRDENWKYTSIRSLVRNVYEFSLAGSSTASRIPLIEGLESIRLVFVDGWFSDKLSDLKALPEDVFCKELSSAIEERPELLESKLGKAMPEDSHGFSKLNGAFLCTGLMVHVPAGCELELPIEIVYVSSGESERAVQPRNLIVMEESSVAVVIERYVCLNQGRYLNNSVTELFLEEKANLEFCRLQEESAKASQIAGLFSRQLANSTLTVNGVTLDGLLVRNDIHLSLDAPDATCHLNGLAVTDGRQHVDNFTQVNHNVERCVSKELFKGVLDGRSRNVFHGRIVVAKDAQQTDSEQQNQNLLLSRDAEVDTKPQLEIYADDVKCSHGATVGQMDADSLFYLRSRGIDEQTARGMLTFAFADDALQGISNQHLRKHIELKVSSTLGEA